MELDRGFAMGWVYLGWTLDALSFPGWSGDPLQHNLRAIEYANRALALDGTLGNAHALLGESFGQLGQVEPSLQELELALSLSPNDSKVLAVASLWHSTYGMPEKGLQLIQKARRINPLPPHWFQHPSGLANYGVGNYEEALLDAERCVTQLPDFIWCYITLAKASQSLGREEVAKSAAKNILRIAPGYKIAPYLPEREKTLLRGAEGCPTDHVLVHPGHLTVRVTPSW